MNCFDEEKKRIEDFFNSIDPYKLYDILVNEFGFVEVDEIGGSYEKSGDSTFSISSIGTNFVEVPKIDFMNFCPVCPINVMKNSNYNSNEQLYQLAS